MLQKQGNDIFVCRCQRFITWRMVQCSGGSVIRSLGEVRLDNWQCMYKSISLIHRNLSPLHSSFTSHLFTIKSNAGCCSKIPIQSWKFRHIFLETYKYTIYLSLITVGFAITAKYKTPPSSWLLQFSLLLIEQIIWVDWVVNWANYLSFFLKKLN